MTTSTSAYAQAVVALARGEDALDTVADELLTIARAVGGNEQLRQQLRDENLPVANRLAFVESDALRAAHPATRTTLAMIIAANRAGELTTIAEEVADAAAAARDEVVAEVRVAVALDEPRKQALKAGPRTGHRQEARPEGVRRRVRGGRGARPHR
jgi:F-type H+-transporting ATPase subunit delta